MADSDSAERGWGRPVIHDSWLAGWVHRKDLMRNLLSKSAKRRDGPIAFVLNVSVAGLGAVRSLGRAGIPVIGLDPDPNHGGFASRYCTAKRCPHPVDEPEQLIDFLLREGQQLAEPGILSPASDAFVLFISRHRDVLRRYFRFNLAPPDVIEASLDKRKLNELADRVGQPRAEMFCPENLDDVHRVKDDLDYPVFIKPYYSHLWQLAFPELGKGIKAFTPQELVSSFKLIFANNLQAMIQTIIVGPATNVRTVYMYISQVGDPLALVTTQKHRQWPVEFGRVSMTETYHDPALAALGEKFFSAIDYRGFGTIEYKLDDRDGKMKVTDLNPRWVQPINLPIDSGVDFPLLHYLDLAGERPAPCFAFKTGVRQLNARADLRSAWSHYRAGELSRREWARSWLGARSFPVFALDDLGPFLKEYRYGRPLIEAPMALLRRR